MDTTLRAMRHLVVTPDARTLFGADTYGRLYRFDRIGTDGGAPPTP